MPDGDLFFFCMKRVRARRVPQLSCIQFLSPFPLSDGKNSSIKCRIFLIKFRLTVLRQILLQIQICQPSMSCYARHCYTVSVGVGSVKQSMFFMVNSNKI